MCKFSELADEDIFHLARYTIRLGVIMMNRKELSSY